MNEFAAESRPAAEPEVPTEAVKQLAEADFDAAVLQAAQPVAVNFHSAAGEACKALAPRFAAVAGKYAPKALFFRVALADNPALAAKLGVKEAPAIVFFKAGKEQGQRLAGAEIQRTALKAQVDALLK